MNETKETMIFQEIRLLLEQLEVSCHKDDLNEPVHISTTLTEQLLHMSCDRFWMYDPSSSIVEIYLTQPFAGHANKVIRSLSSMLSRVDAGNRKKVASVLERLLNKVSVRETYEYFEIKDGGTVGYDVTACFFEQEGHLKIIGVSHIITETQQSLDRVMQAQQKFELLMGLSSMYIWEYDVKKKRFNANRSLCDKLNIEQRQYTLEELEAEMHIEEMGRFLSLLSKQQLNEKAVLHLNSLKDKNTYIFETSFKAIRDRHGEYAMLIGTMNDITENQMLKTMASKDALTNCYNRNMADMTLETCFKSFKEKGEAYTIIFFDVDKFKSVNDRYGHDMGDFILSSICTHIAKEIRSDDMMFRWGGDEFLLICRGIAKENIYGYIDRLRKGIEFSTFEFNDWKLQVTISIGAAIFYKSDVDYNAAMKRADRSLYKAKLAGRNKVAILK